MNIRAPKNLEGGDRKMEKKEKLILITIRLPKTILDEIDDIVAKGLIASRSEFIRNAILNTILTLKERQIIKKMARRNKNE